MERDNLRLKNDLVDNNSSVMPRELLNPRFERQLFGPGKAGQSAYLALNAAETCEYKSEECEEPPTHTIDLDINGELDHFASCEDHSERFKQGIRDELLKADRRCAPSFGRNGFGRA